MTKMSALLSFSPVWNIPIDGYIIRIYRPSIISGTNNYEHKIHNNSSNTCLFFQATLNASATVDPDFVHVDGVTYEWFCRDMDDTVQFGPDYDSEPLLYVPVVNDTFPPAEMIVSVTH
jgi:hypothetical protein